jgi:hypothetical protein
MPNRTQHILPVSVMHNEDCALCCVRVPDCSTKATEPQTLDPEPQTLNPRPLICRRKLDYAEFVHFVCAFLTTGKLAFGDVADALVLAAARPDASDEEQAQLDSVVGTTNFANFADYRMHQARRH